MNNQLFKEERLRRILEILQEENKVTVVALSRRFGASEVTIRRDLQELAASGKLIRSHRGALAIIPAPPESPVKLRMNAETAAKEQIGKTAAGLVEQGISIFIGSGSTTTFLARRLVSCQHLTVFTNSIGIAQELAACDESITVVLTGGMLRKEELSMLGHIAELTLGEMRVDQVFMGAQALSPLQGWTTDHLPEVTTTRRIIEMTGRLTVVADHTKLGKVAAAYIAPASRITTLVTDAGVDVKLVKSFEKLGIEVILAD